MTAVNDVGLEVAISDTDIPAFIRRSDLSNDREPTSGAFQCRQ